MSAPEFAVGHVIEGKYEIEALLGRGGPLATYRAANGPSQQVALKFYDPDLASFPEVVNELAHRQTITNALPESILVRIVERGKDLVTGAPYTVTYFSTDPSLADLVASTRLTVQEMVAFVRNLARALDIAHARDIAHLSLKPTNLFVGPGPGYSVRLVDFAMSLVRQALPTEQESIASVQWLAPEQQGDVMSAGPAADIFASALLAFFALTGTSYWRSFQSDTFDESAWRAELLGSRVSVSQRAGELSISLDPAFDLVFARALAVRSEERFRTAGQFAGALAAAFELSATKDTVVRSEEKSIPPKLSATEWERPAPTSTSAVVVAPAAAIVAADVPPPPAQMEAVLAEFEVAAPQRFQTDSDPLERPVGAAETPAWRAEIPVVRPRTGLSAPPRRNWSPVLWTAAGVSGLLVAAGIVFAITSNKSSSAPDAALAASAPAASVIGTSEVTPGPANTVSPSSDTAAPTTTAAAAADTRTRAPVAKPALKTLQSANPVQPHGTASSTSRKPCGKLIPCK